MSKQDTVLCVFTKAPVPGKVKTRLIPILGEEKACALYQSLLISTLKMACSANIARIHLYCTPTIEDPFLLECAEKFDVQLCLQEGEDLGARMCNALTTALDKFAYALVIGCDCPWLTGKDLELAYAKLVGETDVVLGPATDGGYYLLGLCSPQRSLFKNMPWGGSGVLSETRRRLSIARTNWYELNEYSDLDCPEDLPAYEKLINT